MYIQTCIIITTNCTFHVPYATAISNTKNITGFIAGTATWNVKNSSLPHPLIMHMQKTTGQPE
jgi:hypothetical protein